MPVGQKRRESQTIHDTLALYNTAMGEEPRPHGCSMFSSQENTCLFWNMPQECICSITWTWISFLSLWVSAWLKCPPCPPEQRGGAQRQPQPPWWLWGAAAGVRVCLTAQGFAPALEPCVRPDSQPGQKEKRWDSFSQSNFHYRFYSYCTPQSFSLALNHLLLPLEQLRWDPSPRCR